jgi:hypothetical protein
MRYQGGSATPAKAGGGPDFYEWSVPGGNFSIQLSFDVIDRMAADIMKGFWSLPKRGVEIGGILLGRSAGGECIVIDDYEQVSCEHRRGPSYVLSEPDRRKLEKTLRKGRGGRQVVGFFRSHTRLGLYLDQDDTSLIESYFSSPSHVFLLVRPDASGAGVAGFFFWEEGDIHRQSTYREFPFSTGKLRQPGEVPAPAPAAAPAPVLVRRTQLPEAPPPEAPAVEASIAEAAAVEVNGPEIPEETAAQETRPAGRPGFVTPVSAVEQPGPAVSLPLQRPPRRGALRNARLAIAAAAGLALVSAGAIEYYVVRAPAAPVRVRSTPLLQVRQSGAYLMVNWDRGAPAVRNADRGMLSITDGAYSRDVNLDRQQLQSGSLAYLPLGNDVNFRLRLFEPKGTVDESLRVLTAETVAKAAAPRAPDAAGLPKPEPKPHAKPRRPFFDDGL